jgi:hypothetical protein
MVLSRECTSAMGILDKTLIKAYVVIAYRMVVIIGVSALCSDVFLSILLQRFFAYIYIYIYIYIYNFLFLVPISSLITFLILGYNILVSFSNCYLVRVFNLHNILSNQYFSFEPLYRVFLIMYMQQANKCTVLIVY